jgi:hypothetical protein
LQSYSLILALVIESSKPRIGLSSLSIIIIIINLILIKPKAMQVSYLSLKAKENLTMYFCIKQDEKP